jgi:DNA-directed RNA polymerase specialized sigma subunit
MLNSTPERRSEVSLGIARQFELLGFEDELEKEAAKRKPPTGQLEIFGLPSPKQSTLPSGRIEAQTFPAPTAAEVAKSSGKVDREKELEVWKRWKDKRDKGSFRELLNGGDHGPGYRNLINWWSRRYTQDNQLPTSAVKANMLGHFRRALDNWDPEKGQLNTYVVWNLKKTSRFMNTYSPIARIPEQRLSDVRTYAIARDELEDALGRDPNDFEVSQKLGWDQKKATLIRTEARAHLTMQEGLDESPFGSATTDAMNTIHSVHPLLDLEAKKVLEHTYGLYGATEIEDNNDLAKRMNITPNRVRAIKRRIAKVIEKYRV